MKGSVLKDLRLKANLTQEELANKINVSPSTIRMIEIGKRKGSPDVTNKLADFFNVTLDYLNGRLSENEDEKNTKFNMIDDFIDYLINQGIISDADDIDDATADMILNMVKTKTALKLEKRKQEKR